MVKETDKKNIPSLAEVYQDNFDIGSALTPKYFSAHEQLLIKHFNSLTAENEMKFEALQPEEGKFQFNYADQLVNFAQKNKMKVRGHTLVWHNQNPDWLFVNEDGSTVDRATLLERMRTHIHTVMERYRDKIYCWDVANEVIADEGDELLRTSPWTEIIGDDFVDHAFKFAHEADPDAQLFYNDYNESHPLKRDKIFQLVKGLIERDIPIHGIGLQAHWNLYDPSNDLIKQAIEKYASLGLRIHVTEMDVSVFKFGDRRTDLTEPTEEMLSLQAERYEGFFEIFREYDDVIDSITFWGVADDYTWLDDFPVRGRKNWPFVFDEKHQPKDSFWKITQF